MAAGTRAPIEAKTQAAGLAGTAAGIIIWVLQTYAFKGHAVPAGLVSLIYAGVPGVVAFAAAYFAPHQARPGDTSVTLTVPRQSGKANLSAAGETVAPPQTQPPEPPPA